VTDEAPAAGAREIESPYEAIASATEAAKRGDATAVVEHLVQSGYTSSLVRRIRRSYPDLDLAVCEGVVAEGVAAVHKAVVDKRLVSNPAPYLLRVATRIAGQETYRIRGQVSTDDLEDRDVYRVLESQEERDQADQLKKEALRIARSLIAQLGLENVQRVMGLIFDAIELGHVSITNAEMADVLDLDEYVVRQSRSRGFRRLERLAREHGYSAHLDELTQEEDDEEEG
jgi:DNA-directed RNA polymerase specialized sigma24 family protein